MKTIFGFAFAVALGLGAALNAGATTNLIVNVVVDQYGDGFMESYLSGPDTSFTPLTSLADSTSVADPFYQANPQPAGLGDPMSYNLTVPTTDGDLKIDGSDVIRWYGNYLYFYTTNAPSDGLPLTLQSNSTGASPGSLAGLMPSGLTISSGAQGYVYNATTSSNRGFFSPLDGYTVTDINYYIVTTGTVSFTPAPEPSTISLAVAAVLIFSFGIVSRKKRAV